MRRRSLSSAAVLRALDDARARGYDAVSFTGGEPTIRVDLIDLVRAARRRGFMDVKIQSNGLLFAHAANVDRVIAAGANRFHISIHTHESDAYDALVRRAGSHPLMVAALENLARRNVALAADVILKRDTYRRLPDAVRWLQARGVATAHLWFVSLTDGNRDNVDSMPRMSEVVPFMREAFAWARGNRFELRSLHVPRCLLGDDAAHALDPGADRVMVLTPDASFELRDSKLAGQRHVAACDGCAHRSVCPGVRPDYLERYGDEEIAVARGQRPQLPRRLPVV
jgi:cyclic pyranopterin phosphate synthase